MLWKILEPFLVFRYTLAFFFVSFLDYMEAGRYEVCIVVEEYTHTCMRVHVCTYRRTIRFPARK